MRLTLLALPLALAACATTRKKGDLEDLKPTVESFHRHLRWRDFRGASDFMLRELRPGFLRARLDKNDDRDLTVSDYQLEDCTVSADVRTATCVSRLQWFRLPSSTEASDVITSVFVWDGRNWRLKSQDKGPFPELLPRDEAGPGEAKKAP